MMAHTSKRLLVPGNCKSLNQQEPGQVVMKCLRITLRISLRSLTIRQMIGVMTEVKTARSSGDVPTFRNEIIGLIPNLNAFARSLCNDIHEADDLAQATLMKAWHAQDRYEPGTNLKAWMFTILRNHFYSERRKAWRKNEVNCDYLDTIMPVDAGQDSMMELADLKHALEALPARQYEALILVGAAGYTYEEAAEICGCAIGTIKSRVNRARISVTRLMERKSAVATIRAKALTAADDIIGEARALAGAQA